MVLNKAVDVSVQAMNKDEITTCFGEELADTYGNKLEGALVKALGRTQHLIETRFKELIDEFDLEKKLDILENTKAIPSDLTTLSSDDILSNTILDIQKIEAESIKDAIESVENDIGSKQNIIENYKSQIDDQLKVLSQEINKMKKCSEKL